MAERNMKIIGFEDVRSLNISPEDCFRWVSDMIARKQEAFLPPKTHMNMPGNIFCNVMPSLVPGVAGADWGGVKVVTRYPERQPSLDSKILLFHADSGEFLALMDGNWITAMRTGAVAAHSVIHLAKKDWQRVGMIGLGNVARSSLLVLSAMVNRPLQVKLLRYKDQAEEFAKRFAGFPDLHFTIVDSVEECIRGAEVVISCATYLAEDIARDEWFDEGVLVVPVHTRGFTNCDLFFDKVFADDTGHVDHFKNFSKFRFYGEIGDLINGRSPGRENDRERILAYNIGVSVHDVYFAARIYRMLEQRPEMFDRLADARMQGPADKFWI